VRRTQNVTVVEIDFGYERLLNGGFGRLSCSRFPQLRALLRPTFAREPLIANRRFLELA
jgi:hypothetical protein